MPFFPKKKDSQASQSKPPSESPSQAQKPVEGQNSKMTANEFNQYLNWSEKNKEAVSRPNPEVKKKETTRKKK